MQVTCPNPNCESENVEVDEVTMVMENHYPSPKKTFTPESYCRLSKTVYTGEDNGRDPERPDRPRRTSSFVGGSRGQYGM